MIRQFSFTRPCLRVLRCEIPEPNLDWTCWTYAYDDLFFFRLAFLHPSPINRLINTITMAITFSFLDISTLKSNRYATRRSGNFPSHPSPQAGYDVLCHPFQGHPSYLQKVYAKREIILVFLRSKLIYMSQPLEIYVDDETKLTLHGLQQFYLKLEEREKNRKLNDLLDNLEFNQVCIFVKSVQRATQLDALLQECNFPSICIHSGLQQAER